MSSPSAPLSESSRPRDPQLLAFFSEAVRLGASDVHVSSEGTLERPEARVWLRVRGTLVDGQQLLSRSPDVVPLLDQWIRGSLGGSFDRSAGDRDFSFVVPGVSRFRAHLYRMSGRVNDTWGAVFRAISLDPPTLQDLKLPSILARIPKLHRGLVVVTGATGSGKSSTLAALVHEINRERPVHIVTIEDPIEFVHEPIRSRISQREVGADTPAFADALRSALREDPDVILVGEMRDPETVSVALKAAETGHLVFSTVHTQDAVRTVGRLIALFPPEEQRLVRLRLADNLAGIVSQRLVAGRNGRLAAMEIVLVTQSVRDCIAAPEQMDEMLDRVQKSGDGQSFDRHLVELYLAGQITLETALQSATRPADLERELRFGQVSAGKIPAQDRAYLEQKVVLSRGGNGDENEAEDQKKSGQDTGSAPKNPFESLRLKPKPKRGPGN